MISQVASAGSYYPAETSQSEAVDIKPVQLPSSAGTRSSGSGVIVNVAKVKSAADQVNKALQRFNSNLQFSVDSETKTNIVKVIDTDTKEVIRQFPSQDMIDIAKAIDKLQGILLKAKA